VKLQWDKEYRKWCFAIGAIGGGLVWYWSNLNNSLIFVTAILILWYTRETYDLKRISNKQLIETRKQIDLQLRPYLRLQWDSGGNQDVFDVVNEGEGLAIDVTFSLMTFYDQDVKSEYQIMSRPLIAKSKPTIITTDELNNPANIVKGVSIKGYLNDKLVDGFTIKVNYFDTENRKYRAIFSADTSYNDRFRIVKQGRID
jgi:hypothetical protein